MKILFIIDVQKGFVKENNKFLLKDINLLLKNNSFDKVIATRFVNSKNSQYNKFLNWNKMTSNIETDIAVTLPKNSIIVDKTSYAIPYKIFESLKIYPTDEVYICGLDYDACVLAIGFQLFDLGIQPKFLINLISTTNTNPITMEQFENLAKRNFGKDSIVKFIM